MFNAFGLKAATAPAKAGKSLLLPVIFIVMVKRVVVIVSVLVCTALSVRAQIRDTVMTLNGVEIIADKVSVFSAGLKIDRIDSATLAVCQGANFSALLAEQTPVFLRSYGPGGISTLAIRGTNSSHAGVFWNGINLNQPNMGMTDLSRISSFEFSDISLQSGGASTLLGSGVMGGSLHLSNEMMFSTPWKSSAYLHWGNSGTMSGGIKVNAGSGKLAYSGSFSGEWNKNNFRYTGFDGKRLRLENALVKSASAIQQFEYRLTKKQRLSAGFWFQTTDRLIPPTVTMSKSDQHQWDQAIRNTLEWSYTGNKQSLVVRSAFIDEKEFYESKSAEIRADYHLNTLLAEVEYKRNFGRQLIFGSGISGHLTRADIPYYQGIEFKSDASVWVAASYNHVATGIKSVLNLRQDFSAGYQIPFCPSLSAEIPVSKNLTTRFSTSRNFRVPTMNDRFWNPGGNPDLHPESSWNLEGGLTYKLKKHKLYQSEMSVDIYTLRLENMIQWVPGESGIWSPLNYQKVWSRGVEISSKTDFSILGFKGYFRLGYNYSPSTYRETTVAVADILDKQLIYIPLHKVVETFYVAKSNWYSMFSYSLVGKRFVQSDNAKSIPKHTSIDIYGGKNILTQKMRFRIQAEIRNVFDVEYQSVLYYPEPGRSFSIKLIVSNL